MNNSMNTSNIIFDFEGQSIRMVGTPENPLWVAQDICDALGLKQAGGALQNFQNDEKGIKKVDTLGGEQDMLVVTETGLYRLIFRSNKQVARRFQQWVFNQVLPSLRKTGFYSLKPTQPSQPLPPQFSHEQKLERISRSWDALYEFQAAHNELAESDPDAAQSLVDSLMRRFKGWQAGLHQYRKSNALLPAGDVAQAYGFQCDDTSQFGKALTKAYKNAYGVDPLTEYYDYGGDIGERERNVYPVADPAIAAATHIYFGGTFA